MKESYLLSWQAAFSLYSFNNLHQGSAGRTRMQIVKLGCMCKTIPSSLYHLSKEPERLGTTNLHSLLAAAPERAEIAVVEQGNHMGTLLNDCNDVRV